MLAGIDYKTFSDLLPISRHCQLTLSSGIEMEHRYLVGYSKYGVFVWEKIKPSEVLFWSFFTKILGIRKKNYGGRSIWTIIMFVY